MAGSVPGIRLRSPGVGCLPVHEVRQPFAHKTIVQSFLNASVRKDRLVRGCFFEAHDDQIVPDTQRVEGDDYVGYY